MEQRLAEVVEEKEEACMMESVLAWDEKLGEVLACRLGLMDEAWRRGSMRLKVQTQSSQRGWLVSGMCNHPPHLLHLKKPSVHQLKIQMKKLMVLIHY